jgi:hypothetical protein
MSGSAVGQRDAQSQEGTNRYRVDEMQSGERGVGHADRTKRLIIPLGTRAVVLRG